MKQRAWLFKNISTCKIHPRLDHFWSSLGTILKLILIGYTKRERSKSCFSTDWTPHSVCDFTVTCVTPVPGDLIKALQILFWCASCCHVLSVLRAAQAWFSWCWTIHKPTSSNYSPHVRDSHISYLATFWGLLLGMESTCLFTVSI